MGLSPSPQFEERAPTHFESLQTSNPERRGVLRFQEGITTDTDVPAELVKGAMQGYKTAPGRPNHNANVYEKPAAETMRERAHLGSAAWPDAPSFLGEFAHGTSNAAEVKYEAVVRNGKHQNRTAAEVIND
jgi:hypothetical protein